MGQPTLEDLHDTAIRDLFAALADATAPYDKAQLTAAIRNLQVAQAAGLSAAGGDKDEFTALVDSLVPDTTQNQQ